MKTFRTMSRTLRLQYGPAQYFRFNKLIGKLQLLHKDRISKDLWVIFLVKSDLVKCLFRNLEVYGRRSL